MSAELPARISDGVDPPAPTDFQQAVGVQAEAGDVKSLQASTLLDSSSIANWGFVRSPAALPRQPCTGLMRRQ